ncbi:hypothetical protein GCM10023187_51300 [Nibrella viscosa]|uniref:Outer membrane protein beta-barrel domain-containing protein n=1 Tax=Nibrella viscosa TaxID=1084524 RepID=A0ABP8KWW9_9BACT
MKKCWLLLCLVSLAGLASAQNHKLLSVRVGGGVSGLTFPASVTAVNGKRTTQSASSLYTYAAGVGLNIPLGGRFSLQPELTYVRKSYELRMTEGGINARVQYYFNYVEVPLLLRAFWAKNRFRVFVFGGPAIGYGLNGRFAASGAAGQNSLSIAGKSRFEKGTSTSSLEYFDPAVFNRVDVAAQAGIALGMRMGTGLLFLDGRASLGLTDFSRNEESKFRTGMVTIGYGFPLGAMPNPK